jgi:hypothetical protein
MSDRYRCPQCGFLSYRDQWQFDRHQCWAHNFCAVRPCPHGVPPPLRAPEPDPVVERHGGLDDGVVFLRPGSVGR